ncbi:MAG: class I SAM-dependent methyltransferase [Crenarchaeota archaeon]|nr:class I SAM-dependent methyltransferase [Thermoproteota archaeon]
MKQALLEKVYALLRWPEDLESPEGMKRFDESYRDFKNLLRHPWISELVSRKRVRVLDVCSGKGVGGLALAKALKEANVDVDLTFIDLRKRALDNAVSYARKLLGIEARGIECSATEVHRLGLRADIALVHGLSTPHFDPYQMVRLCAALAKVVEPSGIAIIEEFDRVYGLLCRAGCKEVTIERASEEEIVVTISAGYDVRRGVFRRIVMNLLTGDRAPLDVRLWDVASVAATLWMFFRDVDLITTSSALRGFIVAKDPRGIDPESYAKLPTVARSQGRA